MKQNCNSYSKSNVFHIPKSLHIKNMGKEKYLILLPETTNWIVVEKLSHLEFLQNNIGCFINDSSLNNQQVKFLTWLHSHNLIIINKAHNQLGESWNNYYKVDWINYLKRYPFCFAVLNITEKCNLSCEYCFLKGRQLNKKMEFETVLGILNLLYKLINDGKKSKITIQFHGGEPLLNKEVIYTTVKHINSSSFKNYFDFIIQTNGVSLHLDKKLISFIKNNHPRIRTSISFEPPEIVHNYYRKYRNGKGSFKSVWKSIQLLNKLGINYLVNIVMSPQVCENISDMLNYFKDNNIKNLNFIPLNINDKVKIDSVQEVQLMKFLLDYQTKEKFNFFIPIIDGFLLNLFTFKRFFRCFSNPCGAGNSIFSFNPLGYIFPCDSLCGISIFDMGNVNNVKELPITVANRFIDCYEKCETCPFRNLCSGRQPCRDINVSCPTNYDFIEYMFAKLSEKNIFNTTYQYLHNKYNKYLTY